MERIIFGVSTLIKYGSNMKPLSNKITNWHITKKSFVYVTNRHKANPCFLNEYLFDEYLNKQDSAKIQIAQVKDFMTDAFSFLIKC